MEQRQSLQEMMLEKLDQYIPKKMKQNQLTPYKKINSKWIKDLNVSCKNIKILEENTCSKISDIQCRNIFAAISPQVLEIKQKQTKGNTSN